MGNAITNPGRFIQKKVLHEHLGFKDPKFPHKKPHVSTAGHCAKGAVTGASAGLAAASVTPGTIHTKALQVGVGAAGGCASASVGAKFKF